MIDERREIEEENRKLKTRRTERTQGEKDAILAKLDRLSEKAAARPLEEKQRTEEAILEQEASTRRARMAMATPEPSAPPKGNRGRRGHRTTAKRRRVAAAAQPAKPDRDELLKALRERKTDAEVVTALAQLLWLDAHDGEPCPKNRIPTAGDLASWLPRCDESALMDSVQALSKLHDGRRSWWETEAAERVGAELCCCTWEEPRDPDPVAPRDTVPRMTPTGGMFFTSVETIADAHVRWVLQDGGNKNDPRVGKCRFGHPLASLVADWQQHAPQRVSLDLRPYAIVPHSLRNAERHTATLPLGLDRTTPLGPVNETEQGYLPGLEPPPSVVPPVPWLTLYDLTASGPIQTRGRGAPLAQRLFVEILTVVPRHRRDPEWITAPPVTLRNLFEWCWPRYFDHETGTMRGGYQRNKHLEPLRRALVELDNMRIKYGRYERRLIRVDDLPTSDTALDDPIRFHVRHLPESDRGPMFERAPARRWGVVSAPAWRSTIRLAYLWDEAKARNRGSRIYATRPIVARSTDGVITGVDGKPLRDRHGDAVKDWSDQRAVILAADGRPASDGNPPAFERNPAADRVPELGPDDLIRLAFDDNITRSNRRERLRLARRALRDKEAAGDVVIEMADEGWRIVEARPFRIRADNLKVHPDTC